MVIMIWKNASYWSTCYGHFGNTKGCKGTPLMPLLNWSKTAKLYSLILFEGLPASYMDSLKKWEWNDLTNQISTRGAKVTVSNSSRASGLCPLLVVSQVKFLGEIHFAQFCKRHFFWDSENNQFLLLHLVHPENWFSLHPSAVHHAFKQSSTCTCMFSGRP